jgi:hypothetical protein
MIFFALNDPAVNSVRKSFSFSAVCVIEIEKRNRKNEKMRTSCFNVNARCALLLLLSRSFASSSPNSSVLVVIFIKKQKSKNKEISYKHAQKSGIKQIAIIHRIEINALSLSLSTRLSRSRSSRPYVYHRTRVLLFEHHGRAFVLKSASRSRIDHGLIYHRIGSNRIEIYIYIERERERERRDMKEEPAPTPRPRSNASKIECSLAKTSSVKHIYPASV